MSQPGKLISESKPRDSYKGPSEKTLAEAIKTITKSRYLLEQQVKADFSTHHSRYSFDNKREKITPWLLIRNVPNDLGLRPIPSNNPFWLSPDIHIESSSPVGNGVAGEPNFIHARIHNLGAADAVPVRVDFYWADPSLGLGVANMNFIGSEWVEIRSLHSKDVRCNTAWVPQFVNQGHECIIVNCTNYILDPIHHPFEPVLDRHVGQLNIHVEKATAGQLVKFQIKLNNFLSIGIKNEIFANIDRLVLNRTFNQPLTEMEIRQAAYTKMQLNTALELKDRYNEHARVYKTSQMLRKTLLKNYSHLSFEQVGFSKQTSRFSQVQIRTEIDSHSQTIFNPHAGKQLGERMIVQTQLRDRGRDSNHLQLQSLEMKPFEQRELHLEVSIPNDVMADEFVVLHLMQGNELFVSGGYTYIFQIKK